MRPIAILLLVIFLAAVGLTGYVYLNANVTITDIDCVATDAADQAAVFAGLKSQMDNNIFTGTRFANEELGEAGEYQFYTYTVHLRNNTFVKAEVAELQVTPMNGDVLQLAAESPEGVPARGSGDIHATILTTKEMHNVRELMITYYLWGLPFSTRVTYSK